MQYALKFVAWAAAVQASPFAIPQGVTSIIAPKEPTPSGCKTSHDGEFAMQVVPIAGVKRRASPVSVISDGQPQAPESPVTVISDGQPQAPVSTPPTVITVVPPPAVTVISDGQPQAPVSTPPTVITVVPPPAVTTEVKTNYVTNTLMGTVTKVETVTSDIYFTETLPGATLTVTDSMAPPVSQITDGQPQAPTGQPSAPASSPALSSATGPTATGQPSKTAGPSATSKAPVPSSASPPSATTPAPSAVAASQITDGQVQGPATKAHKHGHHARDLVGCDTDGTLVMMLNNGVLTDRMGRTGYIASNRQFQFDAPPQAGAITTAGYSICDDGSIALGGSKVFYRCRSGNFYNLYDRNWAPQCEAVNFQIVTLKKC